MNLEVRQAKEIEAMAKEFNKRSGLYCDINKVLQMFDKIMGDYDHDIMQPKYAFETEEHKQERYYDKAVRSYSEYYKRGMADIVRESTKLDNEKCISIHALELYDDMMMKSFEVLFPAMDEKNYAMGGMDWEAYKTVYFNNQQSTKASELEASYKKDGNYYSEYLTNELLWKNEAVSKDPKNLEGYKELASVYVVTKAHYEKKNFFSKYFTKKGWEERHELKTAEAIISYKAKDLGVSLETAVEALSITNASKGGLNTYNALKNVKGRFTDLSYIEKECEMTKARDKAEESYYNSLFPKKDVKTEPVKEEAIIDIKDIPSKNVYENDLGSIDEEPEQVSIDLEENDEIVPFEVVNDASINTVCELA